MYCWHILKSFQQTFYHVANYLLQCIQSHNLIYFYFYIFVQELFSVSWKTFHIIEYFFTSSKQPLTGFKLVFSIVPYVICLPYPLGHGTVKKLSNKKWFCFFFSFSGMCKSHHLVECHATIINSSFICFLNALGCLYL